MNMPALPRSMAKAALPLVKNQVPPNIKVVGNKPRLKASPENNQKKREEANQ